MGPGRVGGWACGGCWWRGRLWEPDSGSVNTPTTEGPLWVRRDVSGCTEPAPLGPPCPGRDPTPFSTAQQHTAQPTPGCPPPAPIPHPEEVVCVSGRRGRWLQPGTLWPVVSRAAARPSEHVLAGDGGGEGCPAQEAWVTPTGRRVGWEGRPDSLGDLGSFLQGSSPGVPTGQTTLQGVQGPGGMGSPPSAAETAGPAGLLLWG